MNDKAGNNQANESHNSHHIHLLHREKHGNEKASETGNQSTDLDGAVLKDKSGDCRSDTEAQRDDARGIQIDETARNLALHGYNAEAD